MLRNLRPAARLAAALLFAAASAPAQTPRVLLVGDSWANFMWQARSLRDMFDAHGHPTLEERGSVTTVPGSEAREWVADPALLQSIADELAAYPTIDIVQITLGGNDFINDDEGGGWSFGMPDPGALYVSIASDVATVVDYVLGLDPDLRVLLSAYDYPNYVNSLGGLPCALYCCEQYAAMGDPTPAQLNAAIVQMVALLETLPVGRPRLEVAGHCGLMQYLYGFPGATPPIPPGAILPPGDLELPSPPEAMLNWFGTPDCIHLSSTGYDAVGENLWWSYYHFAIDGIFRDGFEGGDTGAWGP